MNTVRVVAAIIKAVNEVAKWLTNDKWNSLECLPTDITLEGKIERALLNV